MIYLRHLHKVRRILTGIHRLVQLSDMEKRQAPEAIQQYLKLVEELRAQEGKGKLSGLSVVCFARYA